MSGKYYLFILNRHKHNHIHKAVKEVDLNKRRDKIRVEFIFLGRMFRYSMVSFQDILLYSHINSLQSTNSIALFSILNCIQNIRSVQNYNMAL